MSRLVNMNKIEIFTGIFKNECCISLLACCMTIIQNVFEDMYKVCKSRSHTSEQTQQNYEKLLKQISAWSDDLYEKEIINCMSCHIYFQDVVERSFIAWVKNFHKNTGKNIQVQALSMRFFTQKFIEISANIPEILNSYYFSASTFEKKDICMQIIRSVFHASDDFIILFDEDVASIPEADEILPSDSISNVCLDHENTTSLPPDLNTVPAAIKGGKVGS